MITYSEFIAKVKEFEGLRLKAYKCPAGVLTIGYGHTHDVVNNMEITPVIAERLLFADIDIVVCQLNSLSPEFKFNVCNSGLIYALIDFVFNIGFTRFKNSTLLKVLSSIDLTQPLSDYDVNRISKEFMRWTFSNGKSYKGLEARRSWEVSLIKLK